MAVAADAKAVEDLIRRASRQIDRDPCPGLAVVRAAKENRLGLYAEENRSVRPTNHAEHRATQFEARLRRHDRCSRVDADTDAVVDVVRRFGDPRISPQRANEANDRK